MNNEEVFVDGEFYDVDYKIKNGEIVILDVLQYEENGSVTRFRSKKLRNKIIKKLRSVV